MSAPTDTPEACARYRICGLTLASPVALPELAAAEASDRRADIVFRVDQRAPGAPARANWFMSLMLPSGEPSLSCAREPGGYRLRFPGLTDFRVAANGREIVCEAPQAIPAATMRHLLLDQVIPRVLALLGREAVHATSVLTPFGVCAFTGLTGAGKSTLAASFHLAGHPVLSDDCLVLRAKGDFILATPAYPGVRLWADAAAALCLGAEGMLPVAHYNTKRRVLADAAQAPRASNRRALVAVYHLGEIPGTAGGSGTESAIVEAISGRDAFMALLTSGFRLDITDHSLLARQFGFLERVAALVPVRRLHVPKDFAALPAVRNAIIADLRARAQSRRHAA